MRYELAHGRIQTWSLETHLVDHCNLRCASCCQLSPHQPKRFLEPEVLARDLQRAAQVLQPRVFKFTGGEPTLHPQIVECVRIARASGVSERIQVTTNGTRLLELPDAFFEAVDVVKLSWYTSAPIAEKTLERIEARCRAGGAELAVRSYATFQRMTPEPPTHDEAAARAAFASCWLRDRCHTLHRGRFFICSRPPKLEPYLQRRGIANALAEHDGVDLEGPRLLEGVLALLEREEPLESCRHCLGATGPMFPHRQLTRDELAEAIESAD